MCLYPKLIKNKRYESYKLKKGDVICKDERQKYVPVGCGNCYECRRQKAQQWRVRLMEELKVHKYAYFVTLTFSNESLKKLAKEIGTKEVDTNAASTLAVRKFLERWRKRHGKSLRHWLITELGHEGTERIHLHGVFFPNEEMSNDKLFNIWKYGKTDNGEYCNERTINYIIKYVTKIDPDHKTFQPVILCSAGLGANFITDNVRNIYKYRPRATPEYYTLPDGNKISLPTYYRNKLYTQEERDKMWTDRLDKHEIYVNGIRIRNIDTISGYQQYMRTLTEQQKWNEAIGYGNTSKEWQKEDYNITLKMLNGCK